MLSDQEVDEVAADEEVVDALYSQLVVEVKGHDPAVLNSYQQFLQLASKCLGMEEPVMWVSQWLVTTAVNNV